MATTCEERSTTHQEPSANVKSCLTCNCAGWIYKHKQPSNGLIIFTWPHLGHPRHGVGDHCGLVKVPEAGQKRSCHHSHYLGAAETHAGAFAGGLCQVVAVRGCCARACCPLLLPHVVSIDVPRSCIVCCLTYFGLAAAGQRRAVDTAACRGSFRTCVDPAVIPGAPSWERQAVRDSGIH